MKKTIALFVFVFVLPLIALLNLSHISYSAPAVMTIMPVDANVLALFPLDGDTNDYSGNGRHANLIAGDFVSTTLGGGLQVTGTLTNPQGFEWNAHANLIAHPYTIEMILTPEETSSYAKLFGFDDANDHGWYYRSNGIVAYPNQRLAEGALQPNELHYLAFVSRSNSIVSVYFQGQYIGSTDASFVAPAAQAVFFNDDAQTGRSEHLAGVIEEVRISDVNRTPEEIREIQYQLHPVTYVNHAATGANDGSSWADAYTELESALSNIESGDEVWIAEGVYTPVNFNVFNLVDGTAVYGGFAGTESDRGERDWVNNITILSGDIDHNDLLSIPVNESDIQGNNIAHVVKADEANRGTRLDGVTVTASQGAAIYNDANSLIIENVTITGNFSPGNAGGMLNTDSSPLLRNVVFINNHSGNGGGMYSENYSYPVLIDVLFQENHAANNGGGMVNKGNNGNATLINVSFLGNIADGEGGGMTNSNEAHTTINNALFVGNKANYGGAMSNVSGGSVFIINSTFVANEATGSGGAMYNFNLAPTIRNSILWGNGSAASQIDGATNEISNSLIEGRDVTDNGNMDGTNAANTPLVVRWPDVGAGDYGDLQPLEDSPIIDKGNSSVLPFDMYDLDDNSNVTESIPLDLAGEPRISRVNVDLGAYEYVIQYTDFIYLPLIVK